MATTITSQPQASPLDALMAHFASSSKSVQRAFTRYIIDAHAEEVEARRQQVMIKESLTQAFKEMYAGKARSVKRLLDEL